MREGTKIEHWIDPLTSALCYGRLECERRLVVKVLSVDKLNAKRFSKQGQSHPRRDKRQQYKSLLFEGVC